ncbi:hypothetical protein I4U23_023504 [Adineta vaga]|nr:hypothetical protein I4U23_023504 [Adineta vaga]
MSSVSDTVITMRLVQNYLYQYFGPIMILTGVIGCLLNLFVFTQQNLRKNPCSIYFIAYNIANFAYIFSSLLSLTMGSGYNIDPSSYSVVLCRLRHYTTTLFNVLSPFYLILASIDRILITSPSALIRQRSTRRLAYMSIICGTFFWSLFHMHPFIASNIIEIAPNLFVCMFQPGIHLTFVSYYSLVKEIAALSVMIMCGLWSIKNVRHFHQIHVEPSLSLTRRAVAIGTQANTAKNRQMLWMLFLDITIYVLFSFTFAIFLMYQQITQNHFKNVEQQEIELVIRYLCLFSIAVPFCVSFYTNLIVSKTFRKEVRKVFSFLTTIKCH